MAHAHGHAMPMGMALPLTIYIDNDWPIAIVIVIGIVIDIVDMSTATCHCNLSIIIIMVLILFDFVSNYFNSITQSESVSDSVWLNYHDLWNVTDNLTIITSLSRNCTVQHLTNLSHGFYYNRVHFLRLFIYYNSHVHFYDKSGGYE